MKNHLLNETEYLFPIVWQLERQRAERMFFKLVEQLDSEDGKHPANSDVSEEERDENVKEMLKGFHKLGMMKGEELEEELENNIVRVRCQNWFCFDREFKTKTTNRYQVRTRCPGCMQMTDARVKTTEYDQTGEELTVDERHQYEDGYLEDFEEKVEV